MVNPIQDPIEPPADENRGSIAKGVGIILVIGPLVSIVIISVLSYLGLGKQHPIAGTFLVLLAVPAVMMAYFYRVKETKTVFGILIAGGLIIGFVILLLSPCFSAWGFNHRPFRG